MVVQENFFKVEGVPLTPFTDADLVHEDPFQLGLLRAYDSTSLVAMTQPVVPVSNEINCVSSGCHSSEQAILNQHEDEGGFNPNNTPILCASCHSSNALGTAGQPGLPSLSEVIHREHGERTNDCYKCHPGPQTQCLRGVMATQHNFVCQDCHGSVSHVGQSIAAGREPWLEEPSCGAASCHGANYAEEPGKLFRESRGHGGLFCSACHGEPHAIAPSGVDRDNVQNIALQGFSGTLRNCATCHGVTPTEPGPHGIMAQQECCVGTRGNVDGSLDQAVTLSDLSAMIDNLFITLTPLTCWEEGNLDGSLPEGPGSVTLSDLSALIDHLFITLGPYPACP